MASVQYALSIQDEKHRKKLHFYIMQMWASCMLPYLYADDRKLYLEGPYDSVIQYRRTAKDIAIIEFM